jgi:integrase
MRGIYLRGKTYWLAQQVSKKRTFVTLETGDPAEAIQRANEIRQAGVLRDGSILEHTVERYIVECEKSGTWTASSVDSRGPVLKQWAKWMGECVPADVTTEKIRAYHAHRLKSCAESTAYGNLMLLQGFFGWCVNVEKVCRANPVVPLTQKKSPVRIKAPKPAARKDFCSRELVSKLINECPRDDLRFVLFCGFHAGMRKNEIIEARASWFDMKAKQIHLRKHAGMKFKDGEERSVPMTEEFHAFLLGYTLGDGYALHPEVEKGKAIYRWDFDRPFCEYMRAQGVPWVTTHIMRHTFASLLASAGVSIYLIAVWLGDGVGVVQRHYAKLSPEHSQIERAFSPPPPVSAPRSPRRKSASSKRGSRRSQKA